MAAKQPARDRRPPAFVKPFNRLVRSFAGRRYYALLRHQGRKSGKLYDTPVMAWPTAAGIVVPVTWGTTCDWYRNIAAAGGCEVQISGRWYRAVEPRLLEGEAARPYLPVTPRLFGLLFPIERFLLLRQDL